LGWKGWANRSQKLSHTAKGRSTASVLTSNKRRDRGDSQTGRPSSKRFIGKTV
jgi:hypothetical protein